MARTKKLLFAALVFSLFLLILAACQQTGVHTVRFVFNEGKVTVKQKTTDILNTITYSNGDWYYVDSEDKHYIIDATGEKKYIYDIDYGSDEGKKGTKSYVYDKLVELDFYTATAVKGLRLPSAPKPERFGYTFTGFYDSDLCIKQYYDEDMNPVRLFDKDADLNLFAGWQLNTYTVQLDKAGGYGGPTEIRVSYNHEMPTGNKYIAPEKSGYTFGGYADESGVLYYKQNMQSARIWDKESDTTLYAVWLTQYYVTLNSMGGDAVTKAVQPSFGLPMPNTAAGSLSRVDAPQRTGWEFGGYYDDFYTDAEAKASKYLRGKGDMYYDAAMQSAKNWDKEGNSTLYAFWIPIQYNVIGGGVDPYEIYNAKQLVSLSNVEGGTSASISLQNNISLAGVSSWKPISFRGTFEGNNYTISSYSVADKFENNGFFATNSGTIRNLNIELSKIRLKTSYLKNGEEDVTITAIYAGGLVGTNTGNIINCHVKNTSIGDNVTNLAKLFVGGIAGLNSGSIKNSSAIGDSGRVDIELIDNADSNSELFFGGIAGENKGSIEATCSEIRVTASVIANRLERKNDDGTTTTLDSYAATAHAGGLIGLNSGSVLDCYSLGRVSCSADAKDADATVFVGGLIGENDTGGSVRNTFSASSVNPNASTLKKEAPAVTSTIYIYAGGLIGCNRAALSNSFAIGSISGSMPVEAGRTNNTYRGGLVGDPVGGSTNVNCYRYAEQKISFNSKDVSATGVSSEDGGRTSATGSPKAALADFEEASFYTALTWDTTVWNLSSISFGFSIYPKLFPAK